HLQKKAMRSKKADTSTCRTKRGVLLLNSSAHLGCAVLLHSLLVLILRSEDHTIAQLLQTSDCPALQALAIQCLKVICAQLRIGFVGLQHMIDDDQQTVGDGHQGAVLAT